MKFEPIIYSPGDTLSASHLNVMQDAIKYTLDNDDGNEGTSKFYLVTFEWSSKLNRYVANKTYSEIREAVLAGERVRGIYADQSSNILFDKFFAKLDQGYFTFIVQYTEGVDDGIPRIQALTFVIREDDSVEFYRDKIATDANISEIVDTTGGEDSFCVTFSGSPYPGYTADKTYGEISAAHHAGKRVYGVIAGEIYDIRLDDFVGQLDGGYVSFSGQTSVNKRINVYTITMHSDGKIESRTNNVITVENLSEHMPTKLTNPNALTFTGAVTDSYDGSAAKTVNIPTVPTALKNPNALTIDGQRYDGSKAVTVYTGSGKSVKAYNAKGDGSTDDTAAFQSALAAERVVYVPGGTYKLSGGITIRENCMLELAQDAVLNFTQTSGNAITLLRLANLKGNHATIFVPYTFSGNVINCDTGDDEAALGTGDKATANATAVPPFQKWCPQWKMSRYVTDINICKPNEVAGKPYDSNFHYSNDGTCYGTAMYIHCNAEDYVSYMWGVSMSGIRIAGGFNYGIHIQNIGDHEDSWNHDMRIEAVIDACKIGVLAENCRYAHIAVSVQPRPALDGTKYSEHGIKLVDSRGFDLSSCSVWDWNAKNTKWTSGGVYQHIALYGECRGLILGDFKYYEDGADIRSLIYTNTASNLEQMTILQEPFTRWFKPVDGVPYFYDGHDNKKLVTEEEMETKIDAHFITDVVPTFTDVLATATDTDGTIYNGIGYKKGVYIDPTNPPTISANNYACLTGFIPCKAGDTLHAVDLSFANTSYARILFFDASKNAIASGAYAVSANAATIVANSGSGSNEFTRGYAATSNGFKVTIGSAVTIAKTAYVRICFNIANVGAKPMIAVNEEIGYTSEGFLADGIKVKAENVVGLSAGAGGTGNTGSSASIDVTASVGQTIRVKEVDASGKPTKWEAVDYQPRTHGKEIGELLPNTSAFLMEEYGCFMVECDFDFVGGLTYTINWNGTPYTCVAVEVEGMGVGVGNFGAVMGTEYSSEPFFATTSEGALMALPLDGSAELVIGVSGEVYKTIDKCYLPSDTVYGHPEYSLSVFDIEEYFSREGDEVNLFYKTDGFVNTSCTREHFEVLEEAFKNQVILINSEDLFSRATENGDAWQMQFQKTDITTGTAAIRIVTALFRWSDAENCVQRSVRESLTVRLNVIESIQG